MGGGLHAVWKQEGRWLQLLRRLRRTGHMAECFLGLAGVYFGTKKTTGYGIEAACARLGTETETKLM